MKIGIFWFYKDEVLGVSHAFDINNSDSLGMIDSPYEHISYWKRLQAEILELKYIEYEDIPRGRAIFDITKKRLIIYLDKKLLTENRVLKICDFFDAEEGLNVMLRLDPHYRTK